MAKIMYSGSYVAVESIAKMDLCLKLLSLKCWANWVTAIKQMRSMA